MRGWRWGLIKDERGRDREKNSREAKARRGKKCGLSTHSLLASTKNVEGVIGKGVGVGENRTKLSCMKEGEGVKILDEGTEQKKKCSWMRRKVPKQFLLFLRP